MSNTCPPSAIPPQAVIEHAASTTRRRFLAAGAAAAGLSAAPAWAQAGLAGLDAAALGVKPGDGDQSRALGRALERAARDGRPLALGPGLYRAAGVTLPDGVSIVGVGPATRLELVGGSPLFRARGARRVALRGLTLDGANIPADQNAGLIETDGVEALVLDDVAVVAAGASALVMRASGGAIRNSRFEGAGQAALFSMDGLGVQVLDCAILKCRNNGILIRRTSKGDDPSVVSRNRIEDTGALDGGLGWNGNAVNVSKASGVMIADNAIRRSAFTAVRAHESDDVMMTGNLCLESGETCLYAEFGFAGAVISGNLIDGAASGIAVANFNEGGRMATVVGNVVRNLFRRPKLDEPGDSYGQGIGVEADVAVTGNVIENAATTGVSAGWGPYLRDVTISGNVIRSCGAGITVSVVEGVGPVTIVGNTVTGSRRGAVLGYRWHDLATPDLAVDGAPQRPGLTIARNTVR